MGKKSGNYNFNLKVKTFFVFLRKTKVVPVIGTNIMIIAEVLTSSLTRVNIRKLIIYIPLINPCFTIYCRFKA